jgi:hypothetical protein
LAVWTFLPNKQAAAAAAAKKERKNAGCRSLGSLPPTLFFVLGNELGFQATVAPPPPQRESIII